jgi:hypothetical protein
MDDFFKSLSESIRKRATTVTLGTYTLFWLLFHWQGVYTTLFVGEDLIFEKYAMLKNEYVNEYFFGWQGMLDWPFYAGWILPLLLTGLWVWFLPKLVLIHFFRREREYKTSKQLVIIREDVKVEEERAKYANARRVTLRAEEQAIKQEQEIVKLDPRALEAEDYEQFKSTIFYTQFGLIIQAIYEHGGHYREYTTGGFETEDPGISADLLAAADANGLIEIDNDNETMQLTDKGRYFVKRYQSDKRQAHG